MKALNTKATLIFNKLIDKLLTTEDEHFRIEIPSFMPLSFEKLNEFSNGSKIYAMSHYGKQNGDLMADPDMSFLVLKSGFIYPIEWQNDYLGKYQKCLYIEDGRMIRYSPNTYKSILDFANIWLNNIKEQGFI